MTRVNLIAFENGVGNSRDVELVKHVLEKLRCEVNVTSLDMRARRRRRSGMRRALALAYRWLGGSALSSERYDVNIMLEHLWPEHFYLARHNVVIPNPEWFDQADLRLLSKVDSVWTKTRQSFDAFSQLSCRTEFLGFDSEDRYDPQVERQPNFFHLAGKSRMKGSGRLVKLWATHPKWPLLTVLHSRKSAFETVSAANIRYESRYMGDDELKMQQNSHVFHVCLSETEGWGHYIPEALSVGAVVLVTDAPPMNELVTSNRGLLVKSQPIGTQHLATTYEFDLKSLQSIVEIAIGMSQAEQKQYADNSRAWFAQNKKEFEHRVACALEHLLAGSSRVTN